MTFEVDKGSGIPVYCQIADWIEEKIEEGTLKEGERLPAERKLCGLTGTARNTVKRAYEELSKRGRIVTELSSGSYVKSRDMMAEGKRMEQIASVAVQKLRHAGLTRHETEHLFLEYIWNHLPETEKIRTAWVDCSVEILQNTAAEIEQFCNVRVTPLLLDEVLENGGLLTAEKYDVVATTINHYDDIRRVMKQKSVEPPALDLDMVVLAVSRASVSQMAKIEKDMRVIVIYEEEWYRYSIERYLKEFSVKGTIQYIYLGEAMEYLTHNTDKKAVILPQDFLFHDGAVNELFRYCMERGIFCFAFQQIIDNGSLMHLKKQMQGKWMGIPAG